MPGCVATTRRSPAVGTTFGPSRRNGYLANPRPSNSPRPRSVVTMGPPACDTHASTPSLGAQNAVRRNSTAVQDWRKIGPVAAGPAGMVRAGRVVGRVPCRAEVAYRTFPEREAIGRALWHPDGGETHDPRARRRASVRFPTNKVPNCTLASAEIDYSALLHLRSGRALRLAIMQSGSPQFAVLLRRPPLATARPRFARNGCWRFGSQFVVRSS
jgi:hypothetical protein